MLYKELKKRDLPDLLTFFDGKPVKDKEDWALRRKELLAEFSSEMYGEIPEKPQSLTAETIDTFDFFCAGKAPLNTVRLTAKMPNGEFSFPVYCAVPKQKPKLTFVMINFRDSVPDRYLPSEELVDNGCAVFSLCYEDITSDNGDFTNGLAGVLFPEGKREKADASGKIAMWAWGCMRVLDYIETLSGIDSSRVVVIGHSRLGKTALVTAAYDERFYGACSNDSGCCGAAIERGRTPESEHYKDIYENFGYWFCPNFSEYAKNGTYPRFDQHALLAAIAPRKICVGSASLDAWADPKSEFLACVAATPVYELLGYKGFIHNNKYLECPDSLKEGDIGYHIRHGLHYFSRTDWLYYLKYFLG